MTTASPPSPAPPIPVADPAKTPPIRAAGELFEPLPHELEEVRGSRLRRVVRGFFSTPASIIGSLLLVGFVLVAIFAPVIAPCPAAPDPAGLNCRNYGPYNVPDYGHASQPKPPSAEHPFGLTPQQNDIFYGVVWGTRTAFMVGLVIVGLTLLLGISIGASAGYFGGWADEVLMRVVEIFMCFPFFVAAIGLATVLSATNVSLFGRDLSSGVIPAVMALVAFSWMSYARLIRSDVLSVREREYIWASKSLGAGHFRVITRHIVPNSIFPVLVLASLDIGTVVLTFAALSFLGIGVPPGYADWGQMISGAKDSVPRLDEHWYLVVYPGLAIVLFSLSWNLIGDTVRDLLDPRFSRQR